MLLIIFTFAACMYSPSVRVRTCMRMRLYNAHFVFILRRRYHYRATRHVIPACTSPDYLYGTRRSLPRREKCTLDVAKPPPTCMRYTRNIHATLHVVHMSHAHSGACARYVLWIRLHTLLTASACISGSCTTKRRYGRDAAILLEIAIKKRQRRKLVRRAKCVRLETRSADGTRAGPSF